MTFPQSTKVPSGEEGREKGHLRSNSKEGPLYDTQQSSFFYFLSLFACFYFAIYENLIFPVP